MAQASLGSGKTGPGRLSWLLITGGRRSLNKAVALAFDGFGKTPLLAVKMTRIPESTRALAREALTLATLHGRPGGMAGIPRVLFCQRYGPLLAVGETAVVGVSLADAVREENFAELARKGTDWLAALAGRPELSAPEAWRHRLVEPVIAQFEADFGEVLDRALLAESKRILAGLGELPLVCEQRDFSPWNVLLAANGKIMVLDWESAEPDGLAGCDLVYFLAHLSFAIDRAGRTGRFRESYRQFLDRFSRTGAVAGECISLYTSRVGLPESALRPLRVLVWMLHSRSEYEHLAADVMGRPAPDALRQSVFLSLWEEEVRHGAGA
jgi:hypothetical protein